MIKTLNITNRSSPLVSVIVAAFNSETTIERCIKSIINQTYLNIEIIIIDDLSTDKTLEKINKFKFKNLKIISNDRNLGPSISRNKGIARSNGEYISILDSDDYILPTKIEIQIDFLKKNKDYSIVGSNVIINNGQKEILSIRKNSHEDIMKIITYYNPFCHSSIIFKRKNFLKTKMYNENIFFGEDHRLIAELLNFGKGFNIQEFLIKKYEIRNVSISTKVSKLDLLYYLFSNRNFIFEELNISKKSFKYLKSLLSILIIFLVYNLRINKEKMRKIL